MNAPTEIRIVRVRSIPFVDSERLISDSFRLCNAFHGKGLADFDGPRRELIDNGIKHVAIHDELARRGIQHSCCQVNDRRVATQTRGIEL